VNWMRSGTVMKKKRKSPLLKSAVMPEFAGQKAKKTMPVSVPAQNGI